MSEVRLRKLEIRPVNIKLWASDISWRGWYWLGSGNGSIADINRRGRPCVDELTRQAVRGQSAGSGSSPDDTTKGTVEHRHGVTPTGDSQATARRAQR